MAYIKPYITAKTELFINVGTIWMYNRCTTFGQAVYWEGFYFELHDAGVALKIFSLLYDHHDKQVCRSELCLSSGSC